MGSRLCLIFNGWGITDFIQQNYTNIHQPLKNHYRNSKCLLTVEKLQANKNKIPSPTWDEMISMLANVWSLMTADLPPSVYLLQMLLMVL